MKEELYISTELTEERYKRWFMYSIKRNIGYIVISLIPVILVLIAVFLVVRNYKTLELSSFFAPVTLVIMAGVWQVNFNGRIKKQVDKLTKNNYKNIKDITNHYYFYDEYLIVKGAIAKSDSEKFMYSDVKRLYFKNNYAYIEVNDITLIVDDINTPEEKEYFLKLKQKMKK